MRVILTMTAFLVLANIQFVSAQDSGVNSKIKSVTGFNIENKKKELDHLTNFDESGLKTEEIEYFSDGKVKTKTTYEYDGQKRCTKMTRYGLKGKIEKVTVFEYDVKGNRTKETTLSPEKRSQHVKVFEYTYY
jgi:hypothetical protein